MKAFFFFFILWSSTFCVAQNINHTIGAVPLGFCYNKGFYLTHGINYKLDFKKNTLFVSTEGTVFNELDARKRRSILDEHIPFLNQSTFVYGREFLNKRKELHLNKFLLLLGFQFFQHGAQPEWDYWTVDSLENNGIRVISGFQTHSASVGTKWSNTTFRESDHTNGTPLSRNTIEVSYLLGVAIKLKGYDEYGQTRENIEIANTYKFNRHGLRFAYKFERFLTKHTSLYAELDLLYVPFINYVPNKIIFTPRGGEAIFPFFPSLKIGFNIFRQPYSNDRP